MTYGQGCLVEEFEVDKTCSYLGVIIGKELGGLAQLKEFNKITYDSHIYLLPRHQDGQKSLQAVKAIKEYLCEYTEIMNLITSVPISCHYVHKFLSKTDFKVVGKLESAVIYNKLRQDVILYQMKVK